MYPKEVQRRIDALNSYTEVEPQDLGQFNIAHMYPTEIAYPDGYYEAMFFNLWLFNTQSMEKAYAGRHDAIFTGDNDVEVIMIYADGSAVIKFDHLVNVPYFNARGYRL